jgi:hypothetical protein
MDGWVYERKDEMKWGECLGVLGIHDTRSYLSPYDLHGCLPFFSSSSFSQNMGDCNNR